MSTVSLSEKEHGLLVEILEREIPDLRDEIWHTDDHDYRESLREPLRRGRGTSRSCWASSKRAKPEKGRVLQPDFSEKGDYR